MTKINPVLTDAGISGYDVQIQRAYQPMWRISDEPSKPSFFDENTCARLSIVIDFFDDAAANAFQAKVLEMMPRGDSDE
jgi:hypothetical protein